MAFPPNIIYKLFEKNFAEVFQKETFFEQSYKK